MAALLTNLDTFSSKEMKKAYQVLKDYGCRVQFFGTDKQGSLSVCDVQHSDFMISVDRSVPESKQNFLVWQTGPFVQYKTVKDKNGQEIKDKFGRSQYEVMRDDKGNPMKDKDGRPIYMPEPMIVRSNDEMLRLALCDIVKLSARYSNIDGMVKTHSDYLRTYEWHEMTPDEVKKFRDKMVTCKKRINSLLDSLGLHPVVKSDDLDALTVKFNKSLAKKQKELGIKKEPKKKAPKMKEIVDSAMVDMADLFTPNKNDVSATHVR